MGLGGDRTAFTSWSRGVIIWVKGMIVQPSLAGIGGSSQKYDAGIKCLDPEKFVNGSVSALFQTVFWIQIEIIRNRINYFAYSDPDLDVDPT